MVRKNGLGSMSLSHGSEITGQRAKPQGEERLKKHVGARSKVAVLRCAARLAYTFRALTANGFSQPSSVFYKLHVVADEGRMAQRHVRATVAGTRFRP